MEDPSETAEDRSQAAYARFEKAVCVGDQEALIASAMPGFDGRYAEAEKPLPLSLAAMHGRLGCMEKFLGSGASIDARDGEALAMAAIYGKEKALAELLKRGAKVDWVSDANQEMRSPLMWAIHFGYDKCLERLLAAGASPHPQEDSQQGSPMLIAAKAGHARCLALLAKAGAQLESVDVAGRTALMWAAADGHLDCVELLLELGASIEAVDSGGNSPLAWAAFKGNVDCLQALIKAGSNVDALNEKSLSPLSQAARYGEAHAVDFLLKAGARVDTRSASGRTSLMFAVACDMMPEEGAQPARCISLLLEAGSDLDALDENGDSALAYAARSAQGDSLEQLLAWREKEALGSVVEESNLKPKRMTL